MLASEGVGLMVWSPLAGGLLSGKFGRDQAGDKDSRRSGFDFPPVNRDRAYACIDAMRTMATARGVSVAQIALAWLLHQPQVSSVIIGAKRPDQLADNLAATGITLERRGVASARRGQPAAERVSGLDVRAPGRAAAPAVAGRAATAAAGLTRRQVVACGAC